MQTPIKSTPHLSLSLLPRHIPPDANTNQIIPPPLSPPQTYTTRCKPPIKSTPLLPLPGFNVSFFAGGFPRRHGWTPPRRDCHRRGRQRRGREGSGRGRHQRGACRRRRVCRWWRRKQQQQQQGGLGEGRASAGPADGEGGHGLARGYRPGSFIYSFILDFWVFVYVRLLLCFFVTSVCVGACITGGVFFRGAFGFWRLS